jgi:hypothetical protein
MAADSAEVLAKVERFIGLIDSYLDKSRVASHWSGFVDQQLKQGLKPSPIVDGNKNRSRHEMKDAAADVLTAGQELAGLFRDQQLDFSGVMTIRGAVGAHRPQTVEALWNQEKARLRTLVKAEG